MLLKILYNNENGQPKHLGGSQLQRNVPISIQGGFCLGNFQLSPVGMFLAKLGGKNPKLLMQSQFSQAYYVQGCY